MENDENSQKEKERLSRVENFKNLINDAELRKEICGNILMKHDKNEDQKIDKSELKTLFEEIKAHGDWTKEIVDALINDCFIQFDVD